MTKKYKGYVVTCEKKSWTKSLRGAKYLSVIKPGDKKLFVFGCWWNGTVGDGVMFGKARIDKVLEKSNE